MDVVANTSDGVRSITKAVPGSGERGDSGEWFDV